jgi:hypothetical protein
LTLTIHQRAAIAWLFVSSTAFAPLLQTAKHPDAGAMFAQGIVLVTAMIAVVPLLLKWSRFRQWFCWTDALSERQRQALYHRDLRRYYQIAFEDGYFSRTLPYFKRITGLIAVLMMADVVMPKEIGDTKLAAIALFVSWYPSGVMLLVVASLPLSRLIRASVQERRK